MAFNPNDRPPAVQVLKRIVRAAKKIPWFEYDECPEVETMKYPDMSANARSLRYNMFALNMAKREGPWMIDQIERDLEEKGEELVDVKMKFETVCKTGPFDGSIWPTAE